MDYQGESKYEGGSRKRFEEAMLLTLKRVWLHSLSNSPLKLKD